MKRVIYLAFAAAAALSLGACKQFETVPGDPLNTKIYTLDNGLQVYMSVNKEQPRIQTYIAVRAGGKNGPDESTGLAHYFEHLMFKGTEQFGTSDYAAEKPLLDEIEQLFETYRHTAGEAERAAIYHRIDSISYEASKIAIPNEYDKLMAVIGADGTNAWTSMDETVYTEDIPSNQIDNWARIQADRFKNVVLRGFHTELETIYEEKNMSLTQDSRKLWEGLDAALFPDHPYGQRTVLGTQEHLKNPSITNVKNFHDQYYVPNNIRICLSGDFNPREMVKTIEKYFGDWQPNPNIPVLAGAQTEPLASPVVKEVYGLESEMLAMGWRYPGAADLKSNAAADIASAILSNGQAGLFDLDVLQKQKVLGLSAGSGSQPDGSQFIVIGRPKQGQSLEQVKDIALEEFAKLRAGEFSDELFKAAVNNRKKQVQEILEDNGSRAMQYVTAFINGIAWKDFAHTEELYDSLTKDDVTAFAQTYLQDNSCAVVYKRQGEDTEVQKISAPAITPIVTNRDKQSAFLQEVQASEVKPIEPVFVDFSRDMGKFDLASGVDVLYKKNEINNLFTLHFIFNRGTDEAPVLSIASDYITYLGTADKTAEEIASRMYTLACDFSIRTSANATTITVSGLSENMAEAVALVEELIAGAQPDDDILTALKADLQESRAISKLNQRACYSALRRYILYGPEYIKRSVLSNEALAAASSEEVLGAFRDLFAQGHEILYYGPMKEAEFKTAIASCHSIAEGAETLPETYAPYQPTPENSVVMAQYDAKQIYYYQYSDRGEKLADLPVTPRVLYNEYFGGGMNTIVFQEMREARGLAYSAWATMYDPSYADDDYTYHAFIATQNDKMKTAIEAFDEIINNMPRSEAAYGVAVDAIESRLRTQRTVGMDVLNKYRACRRLGISEPVDREVFENLGSMTLDDVAAFQEASVKDRPYTYAILGDIKDLDVDYLKTLGPVKTVSLEDIFGY